MEPGALFLCFDYTCDMTASSFCCPGIPAMMEYNLDLRENEPFHLLVAFCQYILPKQQKQNQNMSDLKK